MKKLAKSALRTCGFELRRIPAAYRDNAVGLDPFRAQKIILDRAKVQKPTIFDIGAHRGQTTNRYRALFADSTVYSFEPYPASFEALCEHHNKDALVKPIQMAVGEEAGIAKFHVNIFDATNSLLPRPYSGRRYYPENAGPKSRIEVKVTSIDEFVSAERVERLDIIKLDIQGGELAALRGGLRTLQTMSPLMIYSEIMFVRHYESAPLMNELWAFLGDLGYTLFNVYQLHTATNGQLRYGDALFVSDSTRKTVLDCWPKEP